jgi:flavin reductase (DIM6/NTAB) family NADH-FMN oxidoreductase RutF/effector-binding domain-containing protein
MEKAETGAFIPMPVAPTVLVGANVDGRPNYLAVGFASGANMKPPVLCVSLNRRHHTVKGIRENGTFSVNIPSAAHMRESDYCGLVSGRSVDKSGVFTSFYGQLGTAPMIEEFPIVCECRLVGQPVDFSMDSVFFGEVIQCYVDKSLYRKGARPDILKIDPLLTGLDRQYRRVGEALGKAFSVGWERQNGKAAPGKASLCAIVSRPPRHVLSLRLDPRDSRGQEAVADALGRISEHARSRGLSPIGGPFLRREEGSAPEDGLRAGYAYPSPARGEGDIEAGRMPGGRYAELLFRGPYARLDGAEKELRAYILEQGFKPGGPRYSFFLNEPGSVPEEGLETLLAIPVKRAVIFPSA